MRSWTIVKRRSIFSMLATYWLQVQPQAIRTLLIDIFLLPQEYLFEIPLRNNSLRKNVKQFARRTESREKGGGNILFHWLLQTPFACSPPLLVLHIPRFEREREKERARAPSWIEALGSFSFERNGWPPVGFPGSIMHRWRGAFAQPRRW